MAIRRPVRLYLMLLLVTTSLATLPEFVAHGESGHIKTGKLRPGEANYPGDAGMFMSQNPRIYRSLIKNYLATGYGLDSDTVEDLTQAVCDKHFKNGMSGKGATYSQMLAYIKRSCRNIFIDHINARSKHVDTRAEHVVDAAATDAAKNVAMANEYLGMLSDIEREVVTLRHYKEMTFTEISAKLGYKSHTSSRMIYSEALRKMRGTDSAFPGSSGLDFCP